MAVFFKGMSREEAVGLTLAMRDSGTVLRWDLPGPVVDKHSSGGIGDNLSLMLAPMLAACGLLRADDLGPRPRPHRRHAGQARFHSGLCHAARSRSLPQGDARGGLRDHRPDRRSGAGRQAPLRHSRCDRDGGVDPAHHRVDPVQETRGRSRTPRARREDGLRRLHGDHGRGRGPGRKPGRRGQWRGPQDHRAHHRHGRSRWRPALAMPSKWRMPRNSCSAAGRSRASWRSRWRSAPNCC